MNLYKLSFVLLASILILSCEDTVDVKLREAEAVLVVDAWINDKAEDQHIILTESQPYFDNTMPPPITGATVSIIASQGQVYDFTEMSNGDYVWQPTASTPTFGIIGESYTLNIQLADGSVYQSSTTMNRTAELDSISYTFEEADAFFPDAYIGEFYARDPEGSGDSYWIRTYKNGQLLNKPSEINIAFDAAFSEGSNFDGIVFIQPIRQGMNPLDQDEDDNFLAPYTVGDSAYVEIHSISNEAFYYLSEVTIQTDRPGGFGELFAQPLANVPTNIVPAEGASLEAVGFFNIASVSGLGKKVTE